MTADMAVAGLGAIMALALAGWVISLATGDVTVADTLWPVLFVAAGLAYAGTADAVGPRAVLVLALAGVWGVRLALHLFWRHRGQPEDRRYREMRRRNEPRFRLKSLYLVFGFQGVLAWVVSWPLAAAIAGEQRLGWADGIGVGLWLAGFVFETVADLQLARFRADAGTAGRVMDRGLWRYSRHPNYFGDFCVWWGFWLLAVGAGGWWSIAGPVLMSVLLLRVSGVALLERDIGERRPAYRDYARRTNAFFPGPPRQ